jgi:hypothetical protein
MHLGYGVPDKDSGDLEPYSLRACVDTLDSDHYRSGLLRSCFAYRGRLPPGRPTAARLRADMGEVCDRNTHV